MDTVTTEPTYGTSEYYLNYIRTRAREFAHTDTIGMCCVENIADDLRLTPKEKIRRIRTVAAAVQTVQRERPWSRS